MIGTITNATLIIAGGSAGLFLAKRLNPEDKSFLQIMGVFVLVVGWQSANVANTGGKFVLMMAATLLGGLLGKMLRIEKRLEALTVRIEAFLQGTKPEVVGEKKKFRAFVTASVLYCVGPMAIVGSIQDGLRGDPTILIGKAILDGAISIAMAASMGVGVLFSAIPILLYQGGITFAAAQAQSLLPPAIIDGVSAVGGMLLIFTGFNLLNVTKISVVNLLPGILLGGIAAHYYWA